MAVVVDAGRPKGKRSAGGGRKKSNSHEPDASVVSAADVPEEPVLAPLAAPETRNGMFRMLTSTLSKVLGDDSKKSGAVKVPRGVKRSSGRKVADENVDVPCEPQADAGDVHPQRETRSRARKIST